MLLEMHAAVSRRLGFMQRSPGTDVVRTDDFQSSLWKESGKYE